jgi:hypothetical protein
MTTLMQDVYTAISALAPTRQDFAWVAINTTEPPVYPYVVFHRIVSTSNNSLQGPSDLQNTRLQVDVFDRTYTNAAALAQQVSAALLAAFPAASPISSFDVYEDVVKAHRVSADFSIWATN